MRAERNRELLRRRADPAARDQLVLENIGLVRHIARQYPFGEPDDLVQEGIIGLMKAIQAFDPAKGSDFGRFAAKCIRTAIRSSFRSNGWGIRPPANLHELWIRVQRSIKRLTFELDRNPTAAEILKDLNATGKRTTLARVIRALALNVDCRPLPLEGSYDRGGEVGQRTRMDVTPSPFDTAEKALRALGAEELRQILMKLSPSKRRAILMRFMGGMEYWEIGAVLGMTGSGASFAIRSSLSRLRQLIVSSKYLSG